MPLFTVLTLIGRIAFGLIFLVGGIFNLTYGRTHPEQFYGSFADSARPDIYRRIIRELVIPHGAAFAVLLGVFELTVAVLIFLGGTPMVIGLALGIAFSLAVVPASNTAGAIANGGLVVGQALLLWSELQA